MTDIFDATIVCKKCNKEMTPISIEKGGFILRAVECSHCKDRILHPEDVNKLEHFNDMKQKTYTVKLRMVGNSHAISIPKEIMDFFNEQERMMDNMVRLCFEDFGKLSLIFGGEDGR